MNTQQTAIKAAMAIAKDVAEGRLPADQLDTLAADECRALFGTVAGEDDPLWPLQVDVARQVLALNGVPADELAEWLAVIRAAEDDTDAGAGAAPTPAVGGSWIEKTLEQMDDDECGDAGE